MQTAVEFKRSVIFGDNGGVCCWMQAESIADCVKTAAGSAMQESQFIYDAETGLYYDCVSGQYYDAVSVMGLSCCEG